jgi:hypothetical protein
VRCAFLTLALLALAVPAAALMPEVPLDRLATESDAIVHARVTGLGSRWTEDHATIVTDVSLTVVEGWAGAYRAGDRLELTVEGGEVGDQGIRTEHQPRFRPGEETVLFLVATPAARWRVLALEQGKFTLRQGEALDFRGRTLPLATLRATVSGLRSVR